ncbi:MAG: A24 family peptidase C-terminal domain-containing protein [Methanomicrobiales archaeon]
MIINIPFIASVIAILASIYGSYSDISKGVIRNKLTLPLIVLGITLNGIYAYMISEPWFFILTLIYTAIIFGLCYLFWLVGAWAGGDVKLFTGLAALLPFAPAILNYQILGSSFPLVANYPFPFTLMINSILSILPFLLIYILFVAVKTKPHLLGELFEPVKEFKKTLVLTLVITSAVTITSVITPYLPFQIIIVSLILLYLLSFIISKLPDRLKAVVVSVVTVFALYKNFELAVTGIIFVLISLTVIGIIRKLLTSVSKKALQDEYKVQDLKEGMISAYKIYRVDDEIVVDKKSMFEKLKDALSKGELSNFLTPPGEIIVGSMAAGLTEEDIKKLKELVEEGKLENSMWIKKGVPFAPSILIGLIISIFIGDLVLLIQKLIYSILIYI